jgi:anti-sigma regulatory factor (Ser/Thr protein kinase)
MCWTLDASDVHAARAIRNEATAALRTLTDCADAIGAAELVIGELLSNAARHTDGNVCLEIGRHDGHAEISVYDSSTRFPTEVRPQRDDMAENGRGLFIISRLARDMSVHPFDGIGKRVSVTLDLPCDELCSAFSPCGRPWLRHDSGVCLAPRVARYDEAQSQLGA